MKQKQYLCARIDLKLNMKHTLISFLLIACVCTHAAPAFNEEANQVTFQQSNQSNFSGSSYSSTVYQPFSNTTPAEYSASASGDGTATPPGVTNIHKAFPQRPDTPPQGFPVGEPWVMLAFAVLAAGVIAYKRKKEPTPALPKGKE